MKSSKKPGKAPGIFRKPVPAAKWEKRFLKKVYLPADRKFLSSVVSEDNGLFTLRWDELSAEQAKRLKQIGKVIRKNRRSVSFVLILLIIIIAGGAAFFQFYLKNRMARNLVETGLEKIFLAKVDAYDVNLSILRGEFSISRLTIADAANPMKNLAEFSSVEAGLDTAELLQGRVYVRELGFSDMKLGTARKVSGALDAAADGNQPELNSLAAPGKDEPASSGMDAAGEDFISGIASKISALAGAVDPAEIIEEQKARLASFEVIDASTEELERYALFWQDRADRWKMNMTEWEDSAEYVSSLNTGSFSTVQGAANSITRLQNIFSSAESGLGEIESDYASLEKQLAAVSSIAGKIDSAVAADLAYLESLVSLTDSGAAEWASSIIEDQLGIPLSGYLVKLETGLEWYDRFRRFMENRAGLRPEARRQGRRLPAPADAPPDFVLVRAFGSGAEQDLSYSFELANLAGEPDKWAEPASLAVGLTSPQTGRAEVGISAENLKLSVPEAPFDLGDALKDLDVGQLKGMLSLDADAGWASGDISGRVALSALNLEIGEAVPDSLLYRVVSGAVAKTEPLGAEGTFSLNQAGEFSLDLYTALDKNLAGIIGELVTENADEGIALLKEMFEKELDGPLSDVEAIRGEFEMYAGRIEGYRSELDDLQAQAEKKTAEIEAWIQDKTEKQAEDLLKNVVPEETGQQLKDAGDAVKEGLGGLLNF